MRLGVFTGLQKTGHARKERWTSPCSEWEITVQVGQVPIGPVIRIQPLEAKRFC